MHRSHQLLHLLADGRFYSGARLGKELGVGRSMVWKLVKSLEYMGLEIYAVAGKGYRLSTPIELLSKESIYSQLDEQQSRYLSGVDIHFDIDSTNRYLMHRAANATPSGWACLAEMQSAGRGRRGRSWFSPFAGNIYLSLLWRFNPAPPSLGSMGLAVGLAVVRMLDELGIDQAKLKWPNDVLVDGKKLAGVLLEMAGDPLGECHVVIGVGVNVVMPKSRGDSVIDQPWVDISSLLPDGVSRNRVAGRLLHHLLVVVRQFEQEGFALFRDEWQARDALLSKEVCVILPKETVYGISRGVDEIGALLVEREGEISRYTAGDVSLREVDGM